MSSRRTQMIIGITAVIVVAAVILAVMAGMLSQPVTPSSGTPAPATASSTPTPTAATGGDEPTVTPTGGDSGDEPTDTPLATPTDDSELDDATATGESATAIGVAATDQTATALSPTNEPVPAITAIPTSVPESAETALEDLVSSENILIRNPDSGALIGSGTVRIYAPESVQYPSTARIELELSLETVYITPTPFGDITRQPRETSTPLPGFASPTPREPAYGESGIEIYQRMGASLTCADILFTGCDSTYDLENVNLIAENVTTWSWIITPNQEVSGILDLELALWAVRTNPDNSYDFVDVWSHAFQIRSGTFGESSPILPITIAGVLVVSGIAAAWVIQRRSVSPEKRILTDKPQVFISYRRGASWAQARSIANSIRARGIPVFIDIDNIDEGRFAEIIARAIEECPYFVPVLSPTTLESPWVVREIVSAMQHKKRIIPVLTDGFNFYAANLPEEIREIASHNAITITPEFYEEAIDRLVKRFIRDGEDE